VQAISHPIAIASSDDDQMSQPSALERDDGKSHDRSLRRVGVRHFRE
jgi:hypothetical protein